MYFPEETLRAYIADGKVRLVPELADCAGAKAAEMNGFEVIMISSGDLACSLTGIPDLQLLSIDDFCQATQRITNMTRMPLIVDADDGFGFDRGLNTFYGCKRIMQSGAAGVLVTDTSELARQGQLSIADAVLRFKAARDGLADGYWVDREGRYVRHPQDSLAKRNADYFLRSTDVLDPDAPKDSKL